MRIPSLLTLLTIFSLFFTGTAQEIAVLKYSGGGDWYSNPTALPNLIKFCNSNINTQIDLKPATVEPGSTDIFQFPFVHMTGHGNVIFSDVEIENLRNYLLSGGFLHIDDNYGMSKYVRKEIKRLFPDKELTEIPVTHQIFANAFSFPNGLPKIHEHDALPPQALGILENDRLVLLFTFESDLGDGWESPEVHNDPEEIRLKALKMGANIIKYAFEN
ncbi:DUF4159 domain-containing protein [Christiangramia echinicola]|uniref:DUF4159 domain-containing protein n=1 Tax=Christiangramia echinicola TaxID=279359 RepID=A0A1H1RQD9_9FLAO|nr:DUF4159 domain-containing protein [Christiangramia echinicola]SDS37864.1 protein of unknown function [Christiangramia echinicola]